MSINLLDLPDSALIIIGRCLTDLTSLHAFLLTHPRLHALNQHVIYWVLARCGPHDMLFNERYAKLCPHMIVLAYEGELQLWNGPLHPLMKPFYYTHALSLALRYENTLLVDRLLQYEGIDTSTCYRDPSSSLNRAMSSAAAVVVKLSGKSDDEDRVSTECINLAKRIVTSAVIPTEEEDDDDDDDDDGKMEDNEEVQHAFAPQSLLSSTNHLVVPPLNFAMVAPGVYRSGYPNYKNFPFLQKLGLRSLLLLVPEDILTSNEEFVRHSGIRLFHYRMPGNKEPFVRMPAEMLVEAMAKVLDRRNHPILMQCNKGKHRTGCLVGCLRKLQNWSMTSILGEYRRFAGTKVRVLDEQFIDLFDTDSIIIDERNKPRWL